MKPIKFGKYLLLDRINVGGMAEVFLSKSFGIEGFERLLAIKRILPNMAEDDEFINMFVDEARIAVQLAHPNIAQITELGKHEDQYYIAMEYVQGKDLRQLFEHYRKSDDAMPTSMAAYIISKICEGLDYAHRKCDPTGRPLKVIHRDVSPQNILLSFEGDVKVTDFGIAKAEDRASKTQAGVLKGKFGYMSPEQVRGQDIDHRSDIFAVGILLHELCTGQRLFVGESDFSTLEKVRNAEIPMPRELRPEIPEALENVILKALSREPDERYQNAAEFQDDLQQFLIVDNTIYTAKRLSESLKETYADSITKVQAKMEAFMQVRASQVVPTPIDEFDEGEDGWDDGNTVIFSTADASAADLSSMPTAMGSLEELSQAHSKAKADAEDRQNAKQSGGENTGTTRRKVPLAQKKAKTAVPLWAPISVLGLLASLIAVVLWPSCEPVGGVISLTSTPTTEVQVFINDVLVAEETPFKQSGMAAGEYTVKVKAPGYKTAGFRVTLSGGDEAPIAAVLKVDPGAGLKNPNGTLKLAMATDPPGAELWYEGRSLGKTPLELGFAEGKKEMRVELRLVGFESQEIILADPATGAKHPELIVLKKIQGSGKYASLALSSKPPGAQIWLNGKARGKTPLKIPDLISDQAIKVELKHRGYYSRGDSLTLKPGEARELHLELKKVPTSKGGGSKSPRSSCSGSSAKFTVATPNEANCKVTVGKSFLGTAPVFEKSSPSGQCRVSVQCPSGKKFYKTMNPAKSPRLIIREKDWK